MLGQQDPNTSICGFFAHPDEKIKTLVTHSSGAGWRQIHHLCLCWVAKPIPAARCQYEGNTRKASWPQWAVSIILLTGARIPGQSAWGRVSWSQQGGETEPLDLRPHRHGRLRWDVFANKNILSCPPKPCNMISHRSREMPAVGRGEKRLRGWDERKERGPPRGHPTQAPVN